MTDPVSSNSVLNSYLQQQNAASSTNTMSTANTSSLTSSTGSLTTFLKILTTQLQHQDPTAATDTNQFTQELVQFAGAEQQINTNTKLDNIASLLKNSSGVTGTIGYLGKYIEAPTSGSVPLQGGSSEVAYTLADKADKVTITVQDANGKTVATLDAPTTVGKNYVSWDGKDADGNQLPDGTYKFAIGATNSYGQPIAVSDTKIIAKVTSVSSNTDGTISLGLGSSGSVLTDAIDAVFEAGNLPTATAV